MSTSIHSQLEIIERQMTLIQQDLDRGNTDPDLYGRILQCRENLYTSDRQITHDRELLGIASSQDLYGRVRTLLDTASSLEKIVQRVFRFEWTESRCERTPEQIEQAKSFLRAAAAKSGASFVYSLYTAIPRERTFFLELFEIARSQGNENFLVDLSETTRFDPDLKLFLYQHAHSLKDEKINDIIQRAQIFIFDDIPWIAKEPDARSLLNFIVQFSQHEKREIYQNFCHLQEAYCDGGVEGLKAMIDRSRPLLESLNLFASTAFINGELEILKCLSLNPTIKIEIPHGRTVVLRGDHFSQRWRLLVERFPQSIADIRDINRYLHLILRSGDEDSVRYFLEAVPIDLDLLQSSLLYLAGVAENIKQILREYIEERREAHLESTVGLRTTFEKVEQDPMKFFLKIIKRGFPIRILLEGSPAVDVGGPFKEFISCLVEAIKNKEDLKPLLNMQDKGLPKVEEAQIESLQFYKQLGRFLSLLYDKNLARADKILIGNLFPNQFFQTLRLISSVLNDAPLEAASPEAVALMMRPLIEADRSLKSFYDVLAGPREATEAARGYYKAEIEEYCELVGIDVEEAEQTADQIYERKKQSAIEHAKSMALSYLRPAKEILNGCFLAFKGFIKSVDPNSLSVALQGEEATADLLLASLQLPVQPSFEAQDQEDFFRLQITWIQEKIRGSTPEWRKKFIKAITGHPFLAPGKRLSIEGVAETPRLLEAHTCMNSLWLTAPLDPDLRVTREVFEIELDQLIEASYNGA